MCKVSIIVPIYNVEKYLSRCLESLVNQSFKDIEILAINDGSTDNSLNILNKYAAMDSRIIVVDKKNEGLSQTRNLGIDKAKGEYITFVDSDDWIDKDYIKIMYEKIIKNNSDIVICPYVKEYDYKSISKVFNLDNICINKPERTNQYLYRKIVGPVGKELAQPEELDTLVTAWGKLYKTSIIRSNNIKFIDTKLIGTEDCLFNVEVFSKSKRASIENRPLYHYWKGNKESLTCGYKSNLVEQWRLNQEYIKKHLDSCNVDNVFYEALNNRVCLRVLGLGLNECSKSNKESIFKRVKNLKIILNEKYIKDAYKNLKLKNFKIHWKLFYFFNKNGLAFGSYCMLNTINYLRRKI